MSKPDEGLREVLRRLSLPSESPRFFEELRERMQEHDRAAARRWRRLSIALAAVAASAVAAAAVLAAGVGSDSAKRSVLDETFSCRVQVESSAHAVELTAGAKARNPAFALLYTASKKVNNEFVAQLAFGSAAKGLTVDRSLCRRSSHTIALRSTGLTRRGTVTSSFLGMFNDKCVTAARVLVRVRIGMVGGVPVQAQVAVRNDNAKSAPIAYVIWRPTRVTYFLDSECVDLGNVLNP